MDPTRKAGLEVVAGIGAATIGWLALAIFVWGPLYSGRTAVVGSNGSMDIAASLASIGISARAEIILTLAAVLFGVVALGAMVHARYRRHWARWSVAAATIGLGLIAVVGSMTVGLWLVPGLALAILSLVSGRSPNSASAR